MKAFVCDRCRESFISDQSDEEAEQEYAEIFGPEHQDDPRAVLCDDCWKAIMDEEL